MKNDRENFRKFILAASMFICGFLLALIIASPREKDNLFLADLDDLDQAGLETRLESLEFKIEAMRDRIPLPRLEELVDARNSVAARLEIAREWEEREKAAWQIYAGSSWPKK